MWYSLDMETTIARNFTQYVSPWHNGTRTKIIINRASGEVWTTYQESGRNITQDIKPVAMTPKAIAELEACLVACGCGRYDHS